jgi:hypothetical protein
LPLKAVFQYIPPAAESAIDAAITPETIFPHVSDRIESDCVPTLHSRAAILAIDPKAPCPHGDPT